MSERYPNGITFKFRYYNADLNVHILTGFECEMLVGDETWFRNIITQNIKTLFFRAMEAGIPASSLKLDNVVIDVIDNKNQSTFNSFYDSIKDESFLIGEAKEAYELVQKRKENNNG